jgi:hypothetical protein
MDLGEVSKEECGNIIKKEKNQDNIKGENIYINYFSFDLNYEIITPILKDIQTIAQLIKLIINHQISDIIFIKGNNSYTLNARFYFRYKNIIDFYVKVMDVIETDYFTKICYFVYKTKPKSTDFKVNFLIFYQTGNTTDFHLEIVLSKNHQLTNKILKIIYNEIKSNFVYLLQAIKSNKMHSFIFSSSIIKNEFFVLTKIIQNTKLIEYIIKGKLLKIENFQEDKTQINKENELKNEKEKTFLKVKDEFKVSLIKLNNNELNGKLNSMRFRVLLIKIKEDKMIMQIKVLLNNEINEYNNANFNVITICIRKLTGNSCYIFIKYIWDLPINNMIINYIKYTVQKCALFIIIDFIHFIN